MALPIFLAFVSTLLITSVVLYIAFKLNLPKKLDPLLDSRPSMISRDRALRQTLALQDNNRLSILHFTLSRNAVVSEPGKSMIGAALVLMGVVLIFAGLQLESWQRLFAVSGFLLTSAVLYDQILRDIWLRK